MILYDFGDDRETQAGAARFSKTYKWIEQRFADDGSNSRSIVTDADFKMFGGNPGVYDHDAISIARGLAGVQNQVKEYAFDFSGIKYSGQSVFGVENDAGIAVFQSCANRVAGAADGHGEVAWHGHYSPALGRQFAERIDEIGHLVSGGLDLLVDFALVQFQLIRFVEKFGIGHQRSQVMA